jgi:hypothetical protein
MLDSFCSGKNEGDGEIRNLDLTLTDHMIGDTKLLIG